MNILRQLWRQPLKTLSGLLLMTLAACILCVCVGQALAAKTTKEDLDSRFSTVAIASLQEDMTGLDQIMVDPELIEWLKTMAQQHPDIVKGALQHGILSAAIAELVPYNSRAAYAPIIPTGNVVSMKDLPLFEFTGSNNYASAMLVISLEEISQVHAPGFFPNELKKPELSDYANQNDYIEACLQYLEMKKLYQEIMLLSDKAEGYTVSLVGTVTQVVSLQEGLKDPTGMTARLTLVLPTAEEIEALDLQVGEQYIVYGMDYLDEHRNLVCYMKSDWSGYSHVEFDPYDPSLLRQPTQQERENYAYQDVYVEMMYNDAALTKRQYQALNSISMTICRPSNLIAYEKIRDENGKVIDLQPQTSVTYTDEQGKQITLSMDEYNRIYGVPTIAKLDASVEDFLNSQEGEFWRSAIECDEINHHGFNVIGVENVDYLATFAIEASRIGQGREFTPQEVASGAKVCIIHERIADLAGLQLGDTITLRFYATEHGQPYFETRTDQKGLLSPKPSLYTTTSSILQTEEYTVVGFWNGDLMPNVTKSYYSFGVNTVFVPQSSMTVPMEYCNSLPFISCMLENGAIEEFHKLVLQHGYGGWFKYFDQNYSTIASNFHNYMDLAKQILMIGMGLYAVLMLLFLLLYPAAQRKAVWTLQTMGGTYGQRFAYVLLSCISIVVPATLLGGMIGAVLWDRIVAALQATAESSVQLQMKPGTMLMLVLAQLVAALVMHVVAATLIAIPKGMSNRR